MSEPDYRFTLANERTFLAWTRTSLGLVAAALFVLHLIERDLVSLLLAFLLLVSAAGSMVGGFLRYRAVEAAMRAGRPLPAARVTTAMAVAGVLVVVAVGASAFV